MIKIEKDDKEQLLKLLIPLASLEDRRERKALLIRAGLEELIPQMHLDGPPNVAIPLMINHLSSFGKVAEGHEALGLFLNTIKEDVGQQQQQFLNEIIIQYRLIIR